MSSSFNPKLLISSYFDSLIRHIDIYTEQALETYDSNNNRNNDESKLENNEFILLSESSSSSLDLDDINLDETYHSLYRLFHCKFFWQNLLKENSFYHKSNLHVNDEFAPQEQPINFRSYLNRLRDEMIEELNRAQQEAFDYYESIKDEIKRIKEQQDEENDDMKLDRIFSSLLNKKFYFILDIEERFKKSPFRLYLVKLDFYLNKNERELLGYYLSKSLGLTIMMNEAKEKDYSQVSSKLKAKITIDKEYLLADLIQKYLNDLLRQSKSRSKVKHIIQIERGRQLAAMRRNRVDILPTKSININLELSNNSSNDRKYDFSHLKYFAAYIVKLPRNHSEIMNRYSWDKNDTRQLDLAHVNVSSLSLLTGIENLLIGSSEECQLSMSLFTTLSSSLRRLILSNCDFSDQAGDCFEIFGNLEILEIKNAQNCSHISLDVVPRLKWLILNLSQLPLLNHLSQDLRVLVIAIPLNSATTTYENFLKSLKNFKHEKLEILDISSDNLSMLGNDWLSGFPSLRILKLNSCYLTNLSILPEKIAHLETLSLGENKLKSLDGGGVFRSFGSIKKLDLDSNNLKLNVPNVFAGLIGLVNLKISQNHITDIHKQAFCGLNNLEILDLAKNKLKSLDPNVFDHLSRLKQLNLSGNSLSDGLIDGVFESLGQLEQLDLSENGISKIDSGMFRGLIKLRRLGLNHNKLEDLLPLDVFASMTSLERIEMTYNLYDSKQVDELKKKFHPLELWLDFCQSKYHNAPASVVLGNRHRVL